MNFMYCHSSFDMASGIQPPVYRSGYANSGSGAVGSGSSRLTVPAEAGAHDPPSAGLPAFPILGLYPSVGCVGFPTVGVAPIPNASPSANAGSSALHDAGDALDAGARMVVQQTKLYAEAEAIEAIGVGLEHLLKCYKVYMRHDPAGGSHKLRVLSFNKLCMYFVNHMEGGARFEEGEARCNEARSYAPKPKGREYSEMLMDSKGKELLVLRRFSTVRHKFETCGVGCLLCWLLGYRANWWREEVVAEVEMPAGQKIATIYGIGGSGLQVVPEADTGVGAYRVLFPKAETAPARGSGPIFHILREGTKSPVGRIHRMLDENSGQYQAELTFPAEFVPGKEKAGGGAAAQSTAYTPTPTTPPETKRLTEQAVLLAVAIFLEVEKVQPKMTEFLPELK